MKSINSHLTRRRPASEWCLCACCCPPSSYSTSSAGTKGALFAQGRENRCESDGSSRRQNKNLDWWWNGREGNSFSAKLPNWSCGLFVWGSFPIFFVWQTAPVAAEKWTGNDIHPMYMRNLQTCSVRLLVLLARLLFVPAASCWAASGSRRPSPSARAAGRRWGRRGSCVGMQRVLLIGLGLMFEYDLYNYTILPSSEINWWEVAWSSFINLF